MLPEKENSKKNPTTQASTQAHETKYTICTSDGRPVAVHVRVDTADGGKRMWWVTPDGRRGLGGVRVEDLPLYAIERLSDAREVVLTEGEKAADALIGVGIPAVGTVTGAHSTPSAESLRPLVGRVVVLWPDADDVGRDHMARIAARLADLGARDIYVVEWADAPVGGDAADFIAAGATREDVRYLMHTARSWTPAPTPTPTTSVPTFSLARLGDLLREPEEETRWVVDGLLPASGISLLVAKPKVGKSTLARCLALAVARGEPFFGRATTRGTVIYLALEEKRGEVARHFRALGADEHDPIHVHIGSAPREAFDALFRAIEEHNPTLVIVDPLFRLARMRDANDYAEVTRALEPLIALARASGAHLLLAHHASKSEREGGDAILGSTALFGAVDTAIMMRRAPDGTRTIESIQRYGDDLPASVVTLDVETGRVALAGTVAERRQAEAEDAILAALEGGALTEPEVRDATGMMSIVASRTLRDLVARGLVERTGTGRRGDPYRYARFSSFSSSSSVYMPRRAEENPKMPPNSLETKEKCSSNGLGDSGESQEENPGSREENLGVPCRDCGATMHSVAEGEGWECPVCLAVCVPPTTPQRRRRRKTQQSDDNPPIKIVQQLLF